MIILAGIAVSLQKVIGINIYDQAHVAFGPANKVKPASQKALDVRFKWCLNQYAKAMATADHGNRRFCGP